MTLITARFVKDIAVVGTADTLFGLRNLVVIPVLTKLLGAQEYGLWVQLKVTVMFLVPVALLGLKGSLVKFLGGEQDAARLRSGFSASLWAGGTAATLLAVLLMLWAKPLAAVIFQGPQSAWCVRMIGLMVLLETLDQLALAYLQAGRRMGMRAWFLLADAVAEVALVIWLSVAGHGVRGVVAGLAVWKSLLVLLKLGLIWSRIGIGLPALPALRPYVTFGLPVMWANLFYLVMNCSDRYFINAFVGLPQVGMYAVAYAIGSLLILLLTPLDYVLYPTIAGFWNQGRLDEVRRYVEASLKYALLISLPVLVLVTVFSAPLMALVSGPEFLSASGCVPLIGLGFVCFGIGVMGERILLLGNRPRLVTAIYAGLAVLNLVLNAVLIPRQGMLGAAIATLLTFGSYAALMLSLCQRSCRIMLDPLVLARGGLAGLAMAGVLRVLPTASPGWVAGSAVAGATVYLGVLVLLKAFDQEEVGFFWGRLAAFRPGRARRQTMGKRIRVLQSLVRRAGLSGLVPLGRAVYDYVLEPEAVRGSPLFLQIEPTIICNLECKFCINPFLPRARASLTVDKFQLILQQHPQVAKISLVGIGESFLNKELWQIIRCAKSKGIAIGTTSNGTILTDRILHEIVDSGLDWLNFSLDGATKATYEQMRPGAVFEQVLGNIRRVVSAIGERQRPTLAIWFLSNRENIAELPQMVPLVKGLGIPRLCTQGVHYWGHEDWHAGATRANDIPDLLNTLRAVAAQAKAAGIEFQALNFPDLAAQRGCKWPWKGSYVTADGYVTPCCENGSDPDKINFGNIFTQSYGEIWNSEAYQAFRRQLKSKAGRPAICVDCPSYHKSVRVTS